MVASRYVKASDWDSAIDVLFGGALALLKAEQGGSGGDLCCFLVNVLGKGETPYSAGEKGAFGVSRKMKASVFYVGALLMFHVAHRQITDATQSVSTP